MTFQQFTAEIRTDLQKFDSVGLIQDIDIIKEVYRGLQKFGKFPLVEFEKVITIRNNRGTLPSNFKKLDLAIKCEPFEVASEEKDILLNTKIWSTLDRQSSTWKTCDPCDVTYTKDCIVEKVYLTVGAPPVKFYYNDPIILQLTDGMQPGTCTDTCKNKLVKRSPYEINIKNKTIFTNFKDGTVYVKYYGYPADENGFPHIPNSELGSMEEYLLNRVKLSIVERMFNNGDDTQSDRIGSMLQRYEAKDRDLYLKAMTEYKMTDMLSSMDDYGQEIRRDFEIYNYA